MTKSKHEEEITIYCDNCNSPIQEEPIAYDSGYGRIYHAGNCGVFANARKAFNSRSVTIGNFEYVYLDKALELFKRRELRQAFKLEDIF